MSHERHLITPESGRNAQITYQVRSTGVFLTSSHGVLFDYTWEIPPQDTGMDVNHSNANCACINYYDKVASAKHVVATRALPDALHSLCGGAVCFQTLLSAVLLQQPTICFPSTLLSIRKPTHSIC